jgi:hypothetical protein
MKRILSIGFALALAGGLLSGCDRNDANKPAGSGLSGQGGGSTSGSAGGPPPDEQKRSSTPSKPGSGAPGGTK